ncbi:restriction endonuclease subunit S [Burkholderia ubonensis]|uniref:restriction endonuclease subunit S n=1 Tax=Burkholderia ubonensis TaxID=101571 RepID=UPI000AECC6CD|nr:restriction endonuclease subunit S [Burkholderia ubonensis]
MSNNDTSTMSEQNNEKPALVPRLRFPEFREAGDWEVKELSEFLTEAKQRNRDLKYTPQDVLSVSGELGCVNQIEHMGRSYAGASVKEYRVVETGDLVYTKSPLKKYPFGIFKENKGKTGIVSPLYAIYRPKDGAHSAYFDHYFSLDHRLNAYLQPLIKKGAKNSMTVNNSVVLSGNVITPKLDEQQRIADCLTSLDSRIAVETDKLDALRTHKKGLMQRLFPREGETIPRLRFPDFKDAGEWQRRKVSNLLVRSVSPVNVDAEEAYQEIGIRSHGNGIFHKELVYGKALGDKRVFWVEVGAFVVNIVFAWEQAVAVTSEAERGMIASHRFPMYKAKDGASDVNFIKYFFLTKEGKELLGIASPGGAGRNRTLGQKEFENLEFLVPLKIEEQTEVARCLSSIDELIATQSKKVDALRIHKKSLMQRLFPVVVEVQV